MDDNNGNNGGDRGRPPATDYGISAVLSHMTGSTVELTGRKVDGSPYGPRLLENVSFAPARDGDVSVIGLEPGVGVRQFLLSGVVRMDVELPGSSETHLIGTGDVHTTRRVSVSSDSLEALRATLGITLGRGRP